jgi:hypothetical protein
VSKVVGLLLYAMFSRDFLVVSPQKIMIEASGLFFNEEDSSTLNLPIWPLDGALHTSRRFGGRRWRQGKTS